MEIGRLSAAGSMSVGQMGSIRPEDSVSKNIENQISNIQRQMHGLSSEKDISVEEKMKKRQEYQQEISRLNMELRQRQAEVSREQRRETLESDREGSKSTATDEDNGDRTATLSGTKGMIASDFSVEQARSQGVVVARIEGGIAVLKGEINLDEIRGADVERKEEELAKQEKRARRASASRLSILGGAREELKAAQAKKDGTRKTARAKAEKNDRDRAMIRATNYAKEKDRETVRRFYTPAGTHDRFVDPYSGHTWLQYI